MKNVLPLADAADPPDVELLASGPVTEQPATVLYRLILAERRDGSFVVWEQLFEDEREPTGKLRHRGFSQGSYFKKTEFVLATVRFAERLKADSEAHYASLYREDAIDAV